MFFLDILKEELISARGCTEPIAIAFACAKARETLGTFPNRILVECSGNIIKNVKSVTIPGTEGQVGIEAAAIAGLVAGKSELGMEVLLHSTSEDATKIKELVEGNRKGDTWCEVTHLDSPSPLHLKITVWSHNDSTETGSSSAFVEIKHSHTNVILIKKDNNVLFENPEKENKYLGTMTDRSQLCVDNIYEFANNVDINLVKDLLDKQIAYNMAIAEEGIKGQFGVGFGKVLLENSDKDSISTIIKAYTAAASEARMSGYNAPVITNSGSGNQGISVSVPVILYARYHNKTNNKTNSETNSEELYRALVLSNLLNIHQKTLIGRLSAFCGVVCATCSSAAAITYLCKGTLDQIKMTISNTLANTSGIICDGAKPSCGAKIASSLDAAYMGHLLAMNNRAYSAGDGIVKDDIEKTISSVGRVARDGMKETANCILDIMLEC